MPDALQTEQPSADTQNQQDAARLVLLADQVKWFADQSISRLDKSWSLIREIAHSQETAAPSKINDTAQGARQQQTDLKASIRRLSEESVCAVKLARLPRSLSVYSDFANFAQVVEHFWESVHRRMNPELTKLESVPLTIDAAMEAVFREIITEHRHVIETATKISQAHGRPDCQFPAHIRAFLERYKNEWKPSVLPPLSVTDSTLKGKYIDDAGLAQLFTEFTGRVMKKASVKAYYRRDRDPPFGVSRLPRQSMAPDGHNRRLHSVPAVIKWFAKNKVKLKIEVAAKFLPKNLKFVVLEKKDTKPGKSQYPPR